MEPKVADDLVPLLHPVADLHELPGNPRRGDVEAVKRSYEAFGQRKPIVVKHDGEGRAVVVAGNHQLKAVRELGWDEVAVVWADDLSEDEATAFALADNRVADLGGYDGVDLLTLLQTVDASLLPATGYSDEDINDLLMLWDGPPEFTSDNFDDNQDEVGLDDGWRTVTLRLPDNLAEMWDALVGGVGGAEVETYETIIRTATDKLLK